MKLNRDNTEDKIIKYLYSKNKIKWYNITMIILSSNEKISVYLFTLTILSWYTYTTISHET